MPMPRSTLTPEQKRAQSAKKQRDWRAANPERARELYREAGYRATFGVTKAVYDSLLAAQNGGCAICGAREGSTRSNTGAGRRLSIDHDHETNVVRGLLCYHCNTAIGFLKDDPALMEKAALYVRTANTGIIVMAEMKLDADEMLKELL